MRLGAQAAALAEPERLHHRRIGVHADEGIHRLRHRRLLRLVRRRIDLGAHARIDRVELRLRDAELAGEARDVAVDGIVLTGPALPFPFGHVRLVVVLRVPLPPIGHRLDQRDTVAPAGAIDRLLRGIVDRDDVVAVDGLAVDIMEDEERSRASGMMFGGQSIGMALSTALSGAAIAAYGPSAAYLSSALFIALVTLFVLATRERPGERLLPWSSGRAHDANLAIQADRWWPILKHTFVAIIRPASLIYIPLVMLKGAQFGMLTGGTPLIATGAAGWTEAQVTAMIGTGQLIAGIAGMTIGGFLGDKIGARSASILFFGCWLLLNGTMFLAQPLWADGRFLTVFVIAWLSLDIIENTLSQQGCSTLRKLLCRQNSLINNRHIDCCSIIV